MKKKKKRKVRKRDKTRKERELIAARSHIGTIARDFVARSRFEIDQRGGYEPRVVTILSSRSSIVLPEGIVQLLGYVIVAERILERQIEKIVGFDDLLETVYAKWAIHGPAFPVNVDRYVPRQLVHVLLPTAFCLTVAHEPDYRFHLPSKHLRE